MDGEGNDRCEDRWGGGDSGGDELQEEFGSEETGKPPLLGDLFMERFTDLVHHENIQAIRETQSQMLHTLELSNSKLSSLNDISEKTFERNVFEFRQNIKMLQDMKKQLDSIFRRIRTLKGRVAAVYPQAYAAALKAGGDTDNQDYEDT